MKAKETKQLFFRLGLIFIVVIFLTIIFTKISVRIYENYIIDHHATIINEVISKYPNLEAEMISSILHPTKDKNYDILEKYGITIENIQNITDVKELKQTLFGYFFGFGILSFLLITVSYLLYVYHFHKNLSKVTISINNVLNNKPSLNLEEYEEGIISSLNNDVVKITDRLKNYNEALQKDKKYLEETLSDISHQLKTPLTSMYVINDLLASNNINAADKQQFLEKNQAQLERIEWLVTALLKLSKLESGTIQLKKEEITVQKLIEQAVHTLQIPIELKKQDLKIEGNKKITILCDVNWTREAILNIVKNAHEHTKEEGIIHIKYEENPLYVGIIIKDNGEGIDSKDLPFIFKRFYKGTHNSKESIGIGLNMSKNIIEKQNGVIEVSSKKGQGTTFTIKFYKS